MIKINQKKTLACGARTPLLASLFVYAYYYKIYQRKRKQRQANPDTITTWLEVHRWNSWIKWNHTGTLKCLKSSDRGQQMDESLMAKHAMHVLRKTERVHLCCCGKATSFI
jgi:hypothetical protein